MSFYLLLLFFLVLSAIFSGTEIAFITSNKLKIELNKETGSLANSILSEFTENSTRFITSLLIGNNIALVFFSIYMAQLISADLFIFEENSAALILIQTLITTIIVLIFGEFLPKAIFRIAPYSFLLAFAIPLKYLVYNPLRPVAAVFSFLSGWFIKILYKGEFDETNQEFSSVDLQFYIKEIAATQASKNEEDDINSEMFERALYLREIKVKECMVPRTEIQAVEIDDSIEDLKAKFIETKHSRILIYEESIDNILGYAHHIDLIKKPSSIREALYPMPAVPGTMNARNLLNTFTRQNKNIAQVVDEYGGTAGVVTLEDLIEEIFGEIDDEHDEDDFIQKKISDNEYIFSGRLEIDYINEKYHLEIPEGEYETIAGFVIVNHEDIPEPNETVVVDNFEITIVTADDNRIETLKIKVLSSEEN
jgi:CBS domain containing-hemolysin-like protein